MKKLILILLAVFFVSTPSVYAIEPIATTSGIVTPTLTPLQAKISKLRDYEAADQKLESIYARIDSRIAKIKALSIKTTKAESDLKKIRGDLDSVGESIKKINSELVFSAGTTAEIRAHDLALKAISRKLLTVLSSEKSLISSLKKIVPVNQKIINASPSSMINL